MSLSRCTTAKSNQNFGGGSVGNTFVWREVINGLLWVCNVSGDSAFLARFLIKTWETATRRWCVVFSPRSFWYLMLTIHVCAELMYFKKAHLNQSFNLFPTKLNPFYRSPRASCPPASFGLVISCWCPREKYKKLNDFEDGGQWNWCHMNANGPVNMWLEIGQQLFYTH